MKRSVTTGVVLRCTWPKSQGERERAPRLRVHSIALSGFPFPWPDPSCGLQQAKQTDKGTPAAPRFLQFLLPLRPQTRGPERRGATARPGGAGRKRRLKIPSLVASIDLIAAVRASSFRSPCKPAISSPTHPTVPALAPCGILWLGFEGVVGIVCSRS